MIYVGSHTPEGHVLYASVEFTEYDPSELWAKSFRPTTKLTVNGPLNTACSGRHSAAFYGEADACRLWLPRKEKFVIL